MKGLLGVLVLLFCLTEAVEGQQRDHELTGQRFLEAAPDFQRGFAWGGSAATFYVTPDDKRKRAGRECMGSWNDAQTGAVVVQFVRDHPEKWHEPAHGL